MIDEKLEKERKRQREKYHRLYKGKVTVSPEARAKAYREFKKKFPEKVRAKDSGKRIKKLLPIASEQHHWCYREKYKRDTIELSIEDHNLVHRHLIYIKRRMIYKTTDNVVLDTKQKHLEFIKSLGISSFKLHSYFKVGKFYKKHD